MCDAPTSATSTFLAAANDRTKEATAQNTSVDASRLPNFLAWAKSAGISWHDAFKLEETPSEGVGARASAPFKSGEVIVTVPRRAALSVSTLDDAARQAVAKLAQPHALALAACHTAASNEMPAWRAL